MQEHLTDRHIILRGAAGERILLSGNEAIARGAVEAGVEVATSYPGVPASEIGEALAQVSAEAGMYFEYSTNEIVALEVAAGASLCGCRALTSMKMVGLNVASDALNTLAYTGIRGGLVVVTVDDPNCYSSQNEQDSRYYALLANIPCLEPSNPQEAKDMLLYAIEVSEEIEIPVLLRSSARVSHRMGPVTLGHVRSRVRRPSFIRDNRRFVMVPANARARHVVLLEKMDFAREISDESPHNSISGKGKLGIITAGISYSYCVEALKNLGLDAAVLKIGMTHPIPPKLTQEFLRSHDPILVVEELEPHLEDRMNVIAAQSGFRVSIFGKATGLLRRHGELSVREVQTALVTLTRRPQPRETTVASVGPDAERIGHSWPPILCAGCPHMASLFAIRVASGGRAVHPTDIGCYSLGSQPPLSVGDVMMCMGASAGISCGISKVLKEPVVAIVGDSTFFHGAIPGLINAVYNYHKFVYVVLDNSTAAMTGFQPNPGTGVTAMGRTTKRVLAEDIARACGVDFVRVADPFDIKSAIAVLKQAMNFGGPSLVVFRKPCAVLEGRERRRRGEGTVPFEVDPTKCTACYACIKLLGCPPLKSEENRVEVDPLLCVGCGLCAQICPFQAIRRRPS